MNASIAVFSAAQAVILGRRIVMRYTIAMSLALPEDQEPTVLQYVVGDTAPQIFIKYDDAPNAPPITGYVFALKIEQPNGTIVTRAGTITNAATGDVSFSAFTSGQLVEGFLRAEIEVTDAGGKLLTMSNIYINVTRSVG